MRVKRAVLVYLDELLECGILDEQADAHLVIRMKPRLLDLVHVVGRCAQDQREHWKRLETCFAPVFSTDRASPPCSR